jgi:hypothetical protein
MATNYLRKLMDDPSAFKGSTGYQFALDQGLQATRRSNPAMRGSGNALAAAAKYATGLASQDYGNEFNRALQADTFAQQGDQFNSRLALDDKLGSGALDVSRGRLAMDDRLGTGRLALDDRTQTGQLGLGRDRLGLDRTNSDREFGLGSMRLWNDYDIASRGQDDAREGRYLDYDLGSRRLGLDTAGQENDFNLGQGRLGVDRYNARTNRGTARSADWERRQRNRTMDPWGR